MDRRSFLKALGVGGGASALAACGLDDNRYYTPVEDVLPYVARPEQVTPGTNSYFATTVGTGPSAWPATAVHRDGRVINVGANRAAPWPGAVSSSSLYELQRHFSPDRLTAPTKGGQPIEWTAAVDELAAAVKQAKTSGKKVVWIGPYRSGALAALLDTFTDGNAIHFEALGREAEAKAAQKVFGSPELPRYDLSKAHYVLSFGASFMSDAWGGPGSQSDYSSARNANNGGFVARFAAVTPMKDQTAANADDWYACKPGSEAQVCLAIAKLVAKKTGKGGAAARAVASADENAAAAAAGLTVEHLTEIAEHFAAGHGVALPGGMIGASANAVELAAATYLLNLVGGSSNTFLAGGYTGKVHGYDDVQKLMEAMKAGQVGVLLVDDTDVVHHLPNGADFAAAMGSVPLTVAVTSHPNETTASCGMVLPTHSVFEDWGVEEPVHNVFLVRQPGQMPLHGTMSLGDLLLKAWSKAGMGAAMTFRAFVQTYLVDKAYAPKAEPVEGEEETPAAPAEGEVEEVVDPITTTAFARWFEGVLQAGYVAPKMGHGGALQAVGGVSGGNAEAPGAGDKFLVAFPHPHLLDGRYANQPWAQEMPDPMSGQVWDTWALVHPKTAAALGVGDNDTISINTGSGTLELGVEVHPCVHPDVIAVPTGGGHTRASGRYADAVGKNVASVLPAAAAGGGTQIWQSKASVSKGSGKADLISTFGGDSDRDRGWVAACKADDYAAKKDEPSHHPGEMIGVHHLELDERLQEQGVEGFYPIPDHPTYRFGLTVDTNLCTGCGACSVACYAENNLPVVGKHKVKEGREMSWIRINRYFRGDGYDTVPFTKDHGVEGNVSVHFTPLMCQQCGHAPCESVCPVLATYHSIDGLNAMIYNRCAGTRYCSNACPYSARKFNYHTYVWPEPFNLQLNPDVVTRTMGVMEKCTFCVQRLRRTKSAHRDQGFKNTVPADVLADLVACAEACPSQALTFGNIEDEASAPNFTRKSGRHFFPIADINTYPAVNYLAKASFHFEPGHHGGGGHAGGEHADGGGHGEAGGHADPAHGEKSHEPAHDAH